MYWSAEEDNLLTDFLFDTNYSLGEIARELDKTEIEVKREIRELGLSWVKRRKGRVSRGQSAMMAIMQKLLPGEPIATEEHIGDRLRLDVYCPTYELAAEYHGKQHFFYTPHFHGDKEGFYASQYRDEKKVELCRTLGIALVVFRYDDHLTEEAVFERMLDAIRNTPYVDEKKESRFKGNPYYESQKNRQREYRRKQYRRMKRREGR